MSKKEDKPKKTEKNSDLSSAASKMGHFGGLAGSKARDEALSHEEKVKIAKMGAEARWGKTKHEVKKKSSKKKKDKK